MSEEYKEFGEEYNTLPFGQMKQMITANIPFIFRWKIMQIKLLLKDLNDLCKQNIPAACEMEQIVKEEADKLIRKMIASIAYKEEQVEVIQ